MNNYKVKLDLHVDTLVCELTRENITYASNITQADLKSGCVTLAQLKSIIQSNSTSILPGYNIEINEEYNSISSTHYLILKIEYSNEFIEFEEIFEFKQKGIKQVQDDEITELRKLVIDLQTKLNKQDKLIQDIESRIEENKFLFVPNVSIAIPANVEVAKLFCNQIGGTTKDAIDFSFNSKISTSKYVNSLIFNASLYCKKFNLQGCLDGHHSIDTCDISNITNIVNCDYYKSSCSTIHFESKNILDFNIKKIIVETDLNLPTRPSTGFVGYFLDFYLANKKNFVINEIVIDDNIYFPFLLKYSNYRKLLVKNKKEYYEHKRGCGKIIVSKCNNSNFSEIITHCQANGIEFNYIN